MLGRDLHSSGADRFYPPALFALLTAIVVCSSRKVLNDGDTYTHIAAGRCMLAHHAVLTWDPFSATFAGQPWQAHEWLSEVLLGLAYGGAGLTGVLLLTAAAVAAAFGMLARHIGSWAGWRVTMVLTTAAIVCALPSILARPHMLALPLLEAWAAGLVIARNEGRAPGWWLLGLMVAWANMHGGFAFGIALAAAFAVEATMERRNRLDGTAWRWWGFVAGSVGAALLTPQGWHGLLFPVRLLQFHSLALIKEWQPLAFPGAGGFEAVLLGLVVLLGTGRVRIAWFRLAVLAGLLHLSLAHSRHVLLFGIVGALILAEPVGRAFAERAPAAPRARGMALGWCGMVLVFLLRVAIPVGDADSAAAPVSALAQLTPDVARRPVLNSNQFGGYLALAGLHPFIDGRVELFGDGFVTEYMAMSRGDGTRLAQGVDRYGIRWAVLAVDDPLVARFTELPGWRRQFGDDTAVVFVKG